MKKNIIIIVYSILSLIIVSCAAKQPTLTTAAGKKCLIDAPAWVIQGGAAMKEGNSNVFFGVGSVDGVRNLSLARMTADNRARAEIQKTFETYTASLMKDYMASTTAGIEPVSYEEQHIENAVKTFSAGTLSGVVIIDHWFDQECGTIYSLAKLDLDAFKNSLGKMKEISAEVRDFVRENAEKAFDELSKEEDKR